MKEGGVTTDILLFGSVGIGEAAGDVLAALIEGGVLWG